MRKRSLWSAAALCAVASAAGWLAQPGRTVIAAAQVETATAARISLAEFKKLVDAGNVLVIDVRNAEAYRMGHIPGAILVPEETIARRAKEWVSEKRPIVTYCA